MERTELPKKLLKTNFLVKLPPLHEEEEEGLTNEDDNSDDVLEVVLKSDNIETFDTGDHIIIHEGSRPTMILSIGEEMYAMFSERDVEAIW